MRWFKKIKLEKGQSFVEYSLFLILVSAGIFAMTYLIQRGLQGKISDTKNYMMGTVARVAQDTAAAGVVYEEYEPYYVETNATISQESFEDVRLRKGGHLQGVYSQAVNQVSSSTSSSYQLPPGMGSH